MLRSADPHDLGRRIAIGSLIVTALLAGSNVIVGMLARSTSVVAAGVEVAADVLAACLVYVGLLIASRCADKEHPYGHGRAETDARPGTGTPLGATFAGAAASDGLLPSE